ncbi:hypothetical protein [Hoylesella oralis]|uniref:hypothetical protein n=1 Tax=Hoylesella oralis TaxID=28134 RepID=UPI0028EE5597|nr:hypothetical protein [Hoylesella oralis]
MKGISKAIRKGREQSVCGSFSAPERSRPFDVLSIKIVFPLTAYHSCRYSLSGRYSLSPDFTSNALYQYHCTAEKKY